ncbi:hypothetical protein HFP71_01125 [Streptomyces sp. ARC32]
MLEVEFDEGALARLRVARGSDALWETVLSLQLLQDGREPLTHDPWRHEVRRALHRAGLADDVRALMSLCPAEGYFPDFLTPGLGDLALEDAVDRVQSTPRHRLVAELARLCARSRGPVPRSVRWVATGESTALRWLGGTLRRYHAVAVARVPVRDPRPGRPGPGPPGRGGAHRRGGSTAGRLRGTAGLAAARRHPARRPLPRTRLLRLGGAR